MALLGVTFMFVLLAGHSSPNAITEGVIWVVGIGWLVVFFSLFKQQTWWLTRTKSDFYLPDALEATEP